MGNEHVALGYSAIGRIAEGLDPIKEDLVMMHFHPNVDLLHLWVRRNMSTDHGTGRKIPDPTALNFYRKITQFCHDHNIKIYAKVPMFGNGIHKLGTRAHFKRLTRQVHEAVLWMKALPYITEWSLWNEPQVGSVPDKNPIKLTGKHWSADDVRQTIVEIYSLAHELKPIPVNLYTPAIEPIGISVYGDFEEPSVFLETLLPKIQEYLVGGGVYINAYPPLRNVYPREANFVNPYKRLLKKFPDTTFIPFEMGINDPWMNRRALKQLQAYYDLSFEIGFPHVSFFQLHSTKPEGDGWALLTSDGRVRNDKMDIVSACLDKALA